MASFVYPQPSIYNVNESILRCAGRASEAPRCLHFDVVKFHMRRFGRKSRLAMGAGTVMLVFALPWTRRELLGDTCDGNCRSSPSVAVRAVDGHTGLPLPRELREEGTLTVRDGEYVDSAPLTQGAARDRAGAYDVLVRVPGYREWRRDGVRVPQRICDLKRATLTARLRPVR